MFPLFVVSFLLSSYRNVRYQPQPHPQPQSQHQIYSSTTLFGNQKKKTPYIQTNMLPSISLQPKATYTIIWYECPQCRILLDEMEKKDIKYLFIDNGIYFEENQTIKPLFYKHNTFLGNNLMDIYSELYPM
jgi:hypothetical protein